MISVEAEEFFTGIKYGDIDEVKRILSSTNGKNILTWSEEENGDTAILTATKMEDFDMVQFLLSVGAPVNLKNKNGTTAIMVAASNYECPEIVQLLLSAGADDGKTALMGASRNGYNEIVQLLLSVNSIDLNIQDSHGYTAIMYASEDGNKEIVQLLLSASADVNIQNQFGETAYSYAMCNGHGEIVNLLKWIISINGEMVESIEHELHEAAGANNIEKVKKILSDKSVKCGVNWKNAFSGNTSLMKASKEGNVEVVKLLIEAGTNIDIQNREGDTAIMLASKWGYLEVVRILLESGANLDLQNEDGKIAINFSIERDYSEITKILFERSPASMVQIEFLKSKNFLLWIYLIQINDLWVRSVIERLVIKYPELIDAKDMNGRKAVDIASPGNKLAIESHFLWHRRYRITENRLDINFSIVKKITLKYRPEHVSATCYVYKALDVRNLDEFGNPIKVCLKLIRFKTHFLREIEMRRLNFDEEYVGNLYAGVSRKADLIIKDHSGENVLHGFDYNLYLIINYFYDKNKVMPLADRNLFLSLKQERFAGKNMDEVRHVFTNLLKCVDHMHNKGVIHGDIKPLNIVRMGSGMKLIDLDASCRIGKDPVGVKFSSAYLPPEALAIVINKYKQEKVVIKSSITKFKYNVEPHIADPSFDIWSLGCLLYQLCHPEVFPLFSLVGIDDNLLDDINREDNLWVLAHWTDDIKQNKLAGIENNLAQNLIAQMLSKDPLKRPSIERILGHPFLSKKSVARMIGQKAKYDVFLSYRVQSDSGHAELLYKLLSSMKLSVYLDKECLEPGKNWKEGFCAGLVNSRVFIPLLSKGAINNDTISHQNFSNLTTDSNCDNVFLEHRFALELLQLGLIEKVYPVFIGDFDGNKYGNYFRNNCSPKCPDVHIAAVEVDLRSHMDNQGLGTPIITNRSVASVYKEITDIQGEKTIKFNELANKILQIIQVEQVINIETKSNQPPKIQEKISTTSFLSPFKTLFSNNKKSDLIDAFRKENELLHVENANCLNLLNLKMEENTNLKCIQSNMEKDLNDKNNEIIKLNEEILKLKSNKVNNTIQVKNHPHVLELVSKIRNVNWGWGCDGRKLPGGCKSGTSGDSSYTKGWIRYRCESCDFDYCEWCVNAYR